MRALPLVVQHGFGIVGQGGPITALARIMASDLRQRYRFETCLQDRPAGGVNPRLIWQMASRLRALRPDLLHVRGLQNEGFHGLLAGRVACCRRIVLSVHGLAGDLVYPQSVLRQRIVSGLLEPWTLRHADAVFGVCAHAGRQAVVVRNAKRLFAPVHNAVPIEPLIPRDESLRRAFGFSARDVVAISVTRVTREKGLSVLCDAVEVLERHGERALKVLVVGNGPDLPRLQARASASVPGRIVFAGQRYDVPALLAISDLFVLPSLHENLSNALLEAMHAARAVIATRVGGNPEVVIPGETGLLVPPFDAGALADAMRFLASAGAERDRMGEAGRSRVAEEFAMPGLVRKLDAVYREMLAS